MIQTMKNLINIIKKWNDANFLDISFQKSCSWSKKLFMITIRANHSNNRNKHNSQEAAIRNHPKLK